ncbi:MAG TPA: NAD(P)H-dependent glycerol-3-phosphate dehydrogenase [Acidimicrobiales bacterium]|nr:NAD(P)H-dependent glycerol-3-phosphate dehydrogenase [Acidimicrobiales bacterium]
MFDKVAVIGAGSWGTTVAAIAAGSAPTVLWARRPALAAHIDRHHDNDDYLPGIALPETLQTTASLEDAVTGCTLVVMAVPSHGFRSVLRELAPHLPPGTPVLSLAKGLEQGTHLRMTEVIAQVLPGHVAGVLTGPNLAREIVVGQPAATVVAMTDGRVAASVQQLLLTRTFRVYTNPDVVGCEIAGATKNVLAIAAGILQGLGFGDSSRAALITRGLAELGRLGVSMGGARITIAGLAGVGDLVATCTSTLSRNRMVGEQLGRGRSLEEILAEMRMVAEGVKTARPLLDLAAAHGVEMPIGEQVAAVLDGVTSPADAIPALMLRSAKSEFDGLQAEPAARGTAMPGAGAPVEGE